MHISSSCKGVGHWHGDTSDAFATTFNQFYNPLLFFARRLLPDVLAAEDIVTEIFLKYWEKQMHFNSGQAVKSFLYISTRNACLNHLQWAQNQARAKATLRILTDDAEDFVLNEITRAEVLRDAYHIVEALPVQCRKIVLLSIIGGFSNQQIARRLQLSVNTVRNQKTRGIRLMREKAQLCL